MVEDPVVLVVGQDEQRLVPQVFVRGDRVELARDVLGTGGREVVRVLGLGGGGDDPGHLGQAAGHGVGLEPARRPLLHSPLPQRGGAGRAGELLEPGQRVVVVVVLLLVDLPADARALKPLRVGGPGQDDVVVGGTVVDDGAAASAARVDHPGPHVQPVGVGRAEHRAVVVVADRERLRQRPVERDVGLGEVAHRVRALGRDPLVHPAVVPGLVLRGPGVIGAGRGLRARRRRCRSGTGSGSPARDRRTADGRPGRRSAA